MTLSPPKIIILIITLCGVGLFFLMANQDHVPNSAIHKHISPDKLSSSDHPLTSAQLFTGGQLTTDTSIHSIQLEKVLSGGPGKDGIPALVAPKFTSIKEAGAWLPDSAEGILVTIDTTSRFYPYNILVWHEIVNDTIGDTPVLITFCPLCRSAIVFDPRVDGTREYFGVSGSLYESNLLMYDVTTQSLWSQILGEAVVGSKTGATLTLLPFQTLSFSDVKQHYPKAEILSTETGFTRDYTHGPYGDYNTNDELYFPVSVNDTRFPAKELMYVVNYDDTSVAFKREDLLEAGTATLQVGANTLTVQVADGEIEVTDQHGTVIPGYTALWFSWATHHQTNGLVWKK